MTSAMLKDLTTIRTFLLGGNALFTLVSKRSGNRRTFLVEKAPPKDGMRPGYFVRLLVGPENTSDYAYLGFMFEPAAHPGALAFKPGKTPHQEAQDAFAWILHQTNGRGVPAIQARFEEQAEFWHAGRCCRCGRTLTTPESIAAGIGPVCAEQGV